MSSAAALTNWLPRSIRARPTASSSPISSSLPAIGHTFAVQGVRAGLEHDPGERGVIVAFEQVDVDVPFGNVIHGMLLLVGRAARRSQVGHNGAPRADAAHPIFAPDLIRL